jgi:U4/U6 small nuclear ribonucleoprotein PRP31
MKERMGITDMRKLANRVNFGEIEDDVNQMNIGEGLGALNIGRSYLRLFI